MDVYYEYLWNTENTQLSYFDIGANGDSVCNHLDDVQRGRDENIAR